MQTDYLSIPARIPRAASCLVLLALLSAGAPEYARAADSASPGPIAADTIDVPASAMKQREQALRSPYPVTWIDFTATNANLHDLSDLLESVPGVRVKRYGGLGALATPSVRGSGASQVEVFLDGVPLNSAQWGITNLSELPVRHLDHAEIYRSGSSLASGRVGIGGALHLYTRRADAPLTTFSSSAGSFDTYQNSLIHARPLGAAHLLASYSRTESDGDFTYRYDPGTRFFNEEDDSDVHRENNQFRDESLLLKLLSPLPGGASLHTQGDWYVRRGGIAGHGNLLFEAASREGSRRLTSLLVSAPPIAGGRLKSDISGHLLAQTARYENPLRETGLSTFAVNHETKASGVKWNTAYHWIEAGQTMRVFTERRDERFTPTEDRAGTAQPATFARERTMLYWGAEDRASFADDRVSLTASVRGQESDDNFHGPIPFGRPPEARLDRHRSSFTGSAFGARWEFVLGLAARASRSRSTRFPTLFELFGTSGEVVTNPALVPERATSWDGGVRWTRGAFMADLGVYHAERDSIIYLIQNSQRAFVAQNLERVIAKGVEFEFEWRRGRFDCGASFLSQDVRHDGTISRWNDRWLPYVSPREYALRAGVRAGVFRFSYDMLYADTFYRDRANSPENRAASRTLHNAGVRWQQWRAIAFDFDMRNLTDDTSYDVYGYPMPGRSFYMTMTLDAPTLARSGNESRMNGHEDTP